MHIYEYFKQYFLNYIYLEAWNLILLGILII